MSAKTYTGGCQCGAVRYEVSLELGEVIACNCSRCGRLGSLLAFAPAENFKLLCGEGALTEYSHAASRKGSKWSPSMRAASTASSLRTYT